MKNISTKKISIEISNAELDAMEDFLICVQNKKENERLRKITLVLWMKLTSAYDKK